MEFFFASYSMQNKYFQKNVGACATCRLLPNFPLIPSLKIRYSPYVNKAFVHILVSKTLFDNYLYFHAYKV
jgi:hypothetical protein